MAEYGRGAKAGLVSGAISGIIIAISQAALFQFYTNEVRTAIQSAIPPGSPLTVDQLMTITFYSILIGSFFAGLIGGAILGLIFAAVHTKYMKSSSLQMKGLVFGVVLFIIGTLLGLSGLSYGTSYFVLSEVFSLVANLIFGYLLGSFFGRFGGKVQLPPGTAPAA